MGGGPNVIFKSIKCIPCLQVFSSSYELHQNCLFLNKRIPCLQVFSSSYEYELNQNCLSLNKIFCYCTKLPEIGKTVQLMLGTCRNSLCKCGNLLECAEFDIDPAGLWTLGTALDSSSRAYQISVPSRRWLSLPYCKQGQIIISVTLCSLTVLRSNKISWLLS